MYSILLWPIFLTLIHFNSMRVALHQQQKTLKKKCGVSSRNYGWIVLVYPSQVYYTARRMRATGPSGEVCHVKTSHGFTHSTRLSGIAVTGALQMSVLERIDWRVSSLLYFSFYS